MTQTPNIETFEHDISEEIKLKEASISQIASASGTIENKDTDETKAKKTFLTITSSIFIIFVSMASILGYFMYEQKKDRKISKNTSLSNTSGAGQEVKLLSLMPNFDANVGRFISKTEKTPFGYDLKLANYSYVFSYVLKNENVFKDEALKLLNLNIESMDGFKDITIENQNMRQLTDGTSSLIYSFINTDHLLVATSTEGILSMRSSLNNLTK